MDLGLTGRIALVTGGSLGIGRAVAQAFAEEGARVAICARRAEPLAKAAKEIAEATGREVFPVVADLARSEDCDRAVAETVRAFGGLDILVNNVAQVVPALFPTVDDDQWQALLDLNLMSYIRCSRAAWPHLRRSPAPRIINISGLAGKQLHLPGASTITVTKIGIHGLSKVLAAEGAADGILVNAVMPGPILTDATAQRMTRMAEITGTSLEESREERAKSTLLGRFGTPREVADVVLFVASSRASFITGAVIEVTGGAAKYV